jgi:hypothetical protein
MKQQDLKALLAKASPGFLAVNSAAPASQTIPKMKFGKPVPHKGGQGSWKSFWLELGGKRIYVRSMWEANYARYLEWMKSVSKEILEWDHEPDTFWFDKIKRGVRSYLPDFRVVRLNGDIEYRETKGWMDSKSKTKIKRMKKYHPDVKLFIIDATAYRALNKTLRSLIPGWDSIPVKEQL